MALTWSLQSFRSAVRAGVGREQAHEAIKEHAVATALALRAGATENDLLRRLASDERLPFSDEELMGLMRDPIEFVGIAPKQVQRFVAKVESVASRYPEALRYSGGEIL